MNTGLSWVDTLLDSSQKMRTELKNTVLDGIKLFNAKWRKNSDGGYALSETNKKAEQLQKSLKSQDFEFIGFSPSISYIKEKGTNDQLEAIWVHKLGTPGLLYKHKSLPILVIAGPEIRFNDSIISEIDANKHLGLTYERVNGITG